MDRLLPVPPPLLNKSVGSNTSSVSGTPCDNSHFRFEKTPCLPHECASSLMQKFADDQADISPCESEGDKGLISNSSMTSMEIKRSTSAKDVLRHAISRTSMNLSSAQSSSSVDYEKLQWIIVRAVIVLVGILSAIYAIYCLVALYIRGILWGVIWSILFHPSHGISSGMNVALSRSIIERCEYKRTSIWTRTYIFGWSSRHLLDHIFTHTSQTLGLEIILLHFLKPVLFFWYTFFPRHKRQHTAIFNVNGVAIIALCFFLCKTLGAAAWILLSFYAALWFPLLAIYRNRLTPFVCGMREGFFALFCLLMLLSVIAQVSNETVRFVGLVQNQASSLNTAVGPHVDTYVPFIREKISDLAKEYNIERYTNLVTETLSYLRNVKSTNWTEAFENLKQSYQHLAHAGDLNLTKVSNYLQDYVITSGKGLLEVVGRIVFLLLNSIQASINALYEIILFFVTWGVLNAQKRSILFNGLKRWYGVTQNHKRSVELANRLEHKFCRRFTQLIQLLVHVGVYHWICTYCVAWLVNFPFPMTTALAGALIATLSFLPKFFLATSPALITAYMQGLYQECCTALIITSALWMIGDTFLIRFPDIDPNVIAVSMILGLCTFGMQGVVTGPALALSVQLILEGSNRENIRDKWIENIAKTKEKEKIINNKKKLA